MDEEQLNLARATIADKLRSERERLGLTREALAEKIQSSPETIKNLENKRFWPTLKTLLLLKEALGIDQVV